LGVYESLEIRVCARNLVLVHGKVRVELARDALEEATWRGIQPGRQAVGVDHNGGQVVRGIGQDVSQAAT
jgi:hypothetical protein